MVFHVSWLCAFGRLPDDEINIYLQSLRTGSKLVRTILIFFSKIAHTLFDVA